MLFSARDRLELGSTPDSHSSSGKRSLSPRHRDSEIQGNPFVSFVSLCEADLVFGVFFS